MMIDDYGIDQMVLMENAAIAARDAIEKKWMITGQSILIACGTGSNGGDGFALARHLHSRGADVEVLIAGDANRISGCALNHYNTMKQLPLSLLHLDSSSDMDILSKLDSSIYDLIVDALLGTGLSRSIEGRMAVLINGINSSDVPVLSLDIPSGIDSNTGDIHGLAVKADATVSFGLLKRGNLLYPGYDFGGDLYFSSISFPPELTQDESIVLSINIPPPLRERNPAGHKGSFGKVLIIGGSPDFCGAPALAAAAALRTGSGYVRMAVPEIIASRVVSLVPEVVFSAMDGNGFLSGEHGTELLELAAISDMVVLGPGLSTSPDSINLARSIIPEIEAPLLLDGDALTALAGQEELCRSRQYPTILTPHPGEMARLLESSIREVEIRRIETAIKAAERYAAIIVLKGAHSIIADPSGKAWINLTGNSGMGTAGSGDVLAGIIGSLIAGGGMPLDVVMQGVYLHGLAGDSASKSKGEACMLAGDIIEFLPEAFRIASVDDCVYSKRITCL